MSNATYPIAFAVQSAFLDLLELVESLGEEKAEREALRENAEKTILRFIAAIVLADGQYRDGEKALLALLVDWKAKPGGESRYLNEYAAKWAETSTQIPNFFTAAVRHDFFNKTEIALAMLRNIQLIGANVCACDARCGALERGMVRRYVLLLENHIDRAQFSTGHDGQNKSDTPRNQH